MNDECIPAFLASMARSLPLIFILITLLDSSNYFILQRVKCDKSPNVPTQQGTLVPGMKLGVNHKNSYLWSVSLSSAPSGSFTLAWEPKGRQLHISLGEVVYWSSGIFKDGRFEFISSHRYLFTIVSNKDEDTVSYSTVDQTNRVSAWLLTDAGNLYDTYTGDQIAQADNCDGYSTDRGCLRRLRPSSCAATVGSEFLLRNGYCDPIRSIPRDVYWFVTDGSGSFGGSECKAACWQDCDCLGFDFLFGNQTGCRFWSVDCQFLEDHGGSGTESIYAMTRLIPIAPASHPRSVNPARKWIRMGTAIVSALLVTVILFACYLLIRRKLVLSGRNGKKVQEFLTLMKPNRPTHENGLQNNGKRGHDISVFSYTSILAATGNFSDENKLGEGGFGSVYQGKLVTGLEIAVKKLSKYSEQGTLEFKNELILVYELQHTNLVRLFGFCIHGEERMLIYEFMPNKSLDYYLFDPSRGVLLDWKKRFDIIEGIAQGLLYLHKYSRMRVIHRDLKASNILLDENMNPRISDFGLAKTLSTHNEPEANTKRIVGTYGYMSPEYVKGGNFSVKSDVYSFGVLMLEIICGRRNNSFYVDDRVLTLVGHSWELWKEGAGLELMDKTLGDSCDKDQLLRCIHVGLLCVEENAADRPNMSDIISMLTNEGVPLPKPSKPAFCSQRNGTLCIGGQEPELVSINDLSISEFVAR